MRTLPGLALLLCVAGCQCAPVGGDDGGARHVHVDRFRTLVSDNAREDVPFDLTMVDDFSALAEDDAGFYVIYPDDIEPGTADFHNFPAGRFFMTLNGYNIYTNEESLDLGVVTLGRSGAVLSDGGVTLALQATGMSPWVSFADVLQLTSANAGYVAVNAQSYLVARPDAGDTSALVSLDHFAACSTLREGFAPLIDADGGDRAILAQLTTQVLDGGYTQLRTLVRSVELPPFTMADHTTTTVPAALATPPATDHYTIDLRQTEFAALLPQVNAAAVATSSTVTLSMIPYGAGDGAYTAGPSLAALNAEDPSVDLLVGVDTGDPYPSTWAKMGTARYSTQVNVMFPDGGSRTVGADIVVTDVLDNLLAGPIRPRISPPKNVKVNGGPGDVRAQIPRTPLISWTAPDLGTPSSYGINLFHFSRVGTGPVILLTQDQFFEVTDTQIEIPFGELAPGEEYVFGITAFDSPGSKVTRAPFKGGLPFGAATTLTALFRVDPALIQP
jgi:hypothetical protein